MNQQKRLYYQAPDDECFDDMKRSAIETWRELEMVPEYLSEKVVYISALKNVSDNFMTILSMFDSGNMVKCGSKLLKETRKQANMRLLDGGAQPYELL